MDVLQRHTRAPADAATDPRLLQPRNSRVQLAVALVNLGNVLHGPDGTLVVETRIRIGPERLSRRLSYNVEAHSESRDPIALVHVDVLQQTGELSLLERALAGRCANLPQGLGTRAQCTFVVAPSTEQGDESLLGVQPQRVGRLEARAQPVHDALQRRQCILLAVHALMQPRQDDQDGALSGQLLECQGMQIRQQGLADVGMCGCVHGRQGTQYLDEGGCRALREDVVGVCRCRRRTPSNLRALGRSEILKK